MQIVFGKALDLIGKPVMVSRLILLRLEESSKALGVEPVSLSALRPNPIDKLSGLYNVTLNRTFLAAALPTKRMIKSDVIGTNRFRLDLQ
jgi:hypothetical protein